jgi:hypothetical protein
MQQVLTKREELIKCINDFEFFCTKIQMAQREWHKHPEQGGSAISIRSLQLAPHQRDLVKFIDSNSTTVVLKTRQIGISTLMICWVLWNVMYRKNWKCIYVLHHDDYAKEARRKLTTAYDSLPDHIKMPLKIPANGQIQNEYYQSFIKFGTATSRIGRSDTFSACILDEVDWYNQEVLQDILSAISASCPKKIYISTPRKENSVFHNLCRWGEKENCLWQKSFWEIEEFYGDYQQEWYDYVTAGQSRATINREFLCKFKGAVENTVWQIDPDVCYTNSIYNPNMPHVISFDIGWVDSTYVLIAQQHRDKLIAVDELEFNRTSLSDVCQRVKSLGYRLNWGVIDSQAKKVDLTSGISPHKLVSKQLGIKMLTHKLPDKLLMHRMAQECMYNGTVLVDNNRVPLLIEMFDNLELDRAGGIPHTDRIIDRHDCFVYMCLNYLKARGFGGIREMRLEDRFR